MFSARLRLDEATISLEQVGGTAVNSPCSLSARREEVAAQGKKAVDVARASSLATVELLLLLLLLLHCTMLCTRLCTRQKSSQLPRAGGDSLYQPSPSPSLPPAILVHSPAPLPPPLPSQVKWIVDEALEMVELVRLADIVVGWPGGDVGLSVEQRKRLSIAVELVANPSVVFME